MILTRPRVIAQQRLDLEDWNLLLSAARTDAKFQTKQFLSSKNYILKGFSVTGIGFKKATVSMLDATLIIPEGTHDFSWWTAEESATPIEIPDSELVDGARNYIEMQLVDQDGTPLTRAFWSPEALEVAGSEFNQTTNTVTDVFIQFTVRTGGFSGDPDKLKLAIIDVDGGGNITQIFDERDLFYRLATSANLDNSFSWGSKIEPVYALILSGVSGTFLADEQITIGTETAYVTTGGTTSIAFNVPTGKSFVAGNTVTGAVSGATGTIVSCQESFAGVDKSIDNNKKMFDALMTEIKLMKNTRFWWQDAASSLIGLRKHMESFFVQNIPDATFSWDGTNFKISDASGTPNDSDIEGQIKMMGSSQQLNLTRQDGTGGSSNIAIADGQVLYVEIPATGNRTYDGVGSLNTNYKLVAIGSYVPSDTNYWMAYRQGSRLYVRGYGEFQTGETLPIGDPDYETLLANINTRALRTLNNLTTTAINADLNPDANATRSIGTNALLWLWIRAQNISATTTIGLRDTSGNAQFTSEYLAAYLGSFNGPFLNGPNDFVTYNAFGLAGRDRATAGDTHSGILGTGNAANGNSGDWRIKTGTASATRGAIYLDGRQVDVLNTKIVNVLSPTGLLDAVNKTYADAMGGATTITTTGGTTSFAATDARFFNVTGTLAHIYNLASTATLQVGNLWTFVNRSTQSITIRTSTGSTLLVVPSQTKAEFRVLSTGAETWSALYAPLFSSVDGSINFAGNKGVNAQNPTNPQDVATKAYVDSVAANGDWDAIVGSAADVTAGRAQYSGATAIQDACNAAGSGGTVLILAGAGVVGNLSLSFSPSLIAGQGYGSTIGSLHLTSAADGITFRNVRFTDNVLVDNGSMNHIFDMYYIDTGHTVTDNNSSIVNLYLGIEA